jgi:alpha-glucosidase
MPGWEAAAIRRLVDAYEYALPAGAWPNWVLGNHDQSRIASRIGRANARVAQMMLLTLRGTPTCYYGDEIGMLNVPVPPEMAHDPQELLSPGFGRDPYRSPMQWDASARAGFSSATPWLPIAADYAEVNVAAQEQDPRSTLALFRRLTSLRRAHRALSLGTYSSLDVGHADVFAYVRATEGQRLLVVLNFGAAGHTLDLSALGSQAEVLCASGLDREGRVELGALEVRASEGLLLQI